MSHREAVEITSLLRSWRQGDPAALGTLMPIVYGELKTVAARLMRREGRERPLQPTELVHEVYLRIVELERIDWKDRAHFFAMCARMMRRVLVDQARHHRRLKRGGDRQRVTLAILHELSIEQASDWLALDEALKELSRHDAEKADVVELRFFGGLNRDEIAEVLGISSATVTRRWRAARAWLIRQVEPP